ncbi:MAG: Rieske 2Fe-2S domain-containing protein [Alphaproteobacteria bacterium]|nr:Rieske 2Fe-2S domain-containing protein [Alphaproteobacteria bacterium]
MTFVKNCWYAAGWSSDLEDQPIAKTILEESVVLFRTVDGSAAALENRCPHRFLPLSAGKVTGTGLQCGYHGLTFDKAGRCIAAPTQDGLPIEACVKAFPIVEQLGLLWIWMGEPDKANPDDIYDLPQYHDPAWGVAHGDALEIDANYLLLCDNLCDPTHVNYVHPTTLGNPDIVDTPVTYEQQNWGVTTSRWTPNSEPVGFFKAFGNFSSTVDRWQLYHMHAPSTAIIDFGSAVAGTGADQGAGEGRIQVFSCHFITPITEGKSVDYWLHVRNFEPDDPSVGEGISEQFRIAFAEDKTILSMIQREEDKDDQTTRVGLELDASAGLFRHMVNQRIRDETTSA